MARPAQIQYAGLAGVSRACEDAVLRFLQYGDKISNTRIVTCDGFHALLLTIDEGDFVAVKAGFSSGYSGEGPKTFSRTLMTLYRWGVLIDEVNVKRGVLDRIEASALTDTDLQTILTATTRRATWQDYIFETDYASFSLPEVFRPVLPFALIDKRIFDLALRFEEDPDQALLTGYRRLEASVRSRTGLSLHGSTLFSRAFLGEKSLLEWPGLDRGEQAGRGQMFSAAYTAYRNRRAHHPPDAGPEGPAYPDAHDEFILLNHLFRLEAQAVPVDRTDDV